MVTASNAPGLAGESTAVCIVGAETSTKLFSPSLDSNAH